MLKYEHMFRLLWMLAVAQESFLYFVLRLVQNGYDILELVFYKVLYIIFKIFVGSSLSITYAAAVSFNFGTKLLV